MEDRMVAKILLVEDDPTTRAFLAAATAALPADVDVADSCATALAIAGQRGHDLWLIDANLPDGDGAGLLAALRARGLQTPALAHTAAQERVTLDALRSAGFLDVLVKPMPAAMLQASIRDALGTVRLRVADAPGACFDDAQVWNDRAALAALNGQQAHVDALRSLFVGELPGARDSVDRAARSGDVDVLRSALHRLRASCGFVGASRLGAAVAALQAAPHSADALARFLAAAQDTLSSA
jgi:CheY-like chemotaxis protein/HPt (histidine-containing phosphotransfer) domain-containing protein